MVGIGGLPVWFGYLWSALITAGVEISLALLGVFSFDSSDPAALAVHFVRFVALAVAVVVSVALISRQDEPKDEETQPLLPTVAVDTEDEEEEDDEAYMKARQKERLKSSGGWWAYLKGYSIFLQFIIPRGNLRIQLCIGILALTLLADRVFAVLIPRQLGIITNRLADGDSTLPTKEVVIWIAMVLIHSSCGISLVQGFVRVPITQYSYRQITIAAFNHIMQLSIDFHNDKDSAEVIQAVSQGRALGDLLDILVSEFIPAGIDLVIAYAYFYYLFGSTVLLIISAAAVLYIYLDAMTTDWSMPDYRRGMNAGRAESKTINQSIQGWQTVSFFNRLQYENEGLAKAVRVHQEANRQQLRKGYLSHALMSLVTNTAFFSVVFVALMQISKGEAPVGSFVTLISFWDQLINPIINISSYHRWLQSDLISAERLLVLFQMQPTVKDHADTPDLIVKCGDVAFKDVHFTYDARVSTVDGISFTAHAGQIVALVGETGGGKSTIFKLIYRFYDAKEGSVEIDGQNVRDVSLSSLRANLGIVDQAPYLFNISILENVRYGRLDATDEEIHAACKAAAVHDKILTFPDGYKSVVGDRGIKLSGGELQRVAIAGVLLKNPAIVLLDEATSSIDTDTEVQIQTALATLSKGRTTFVIAHRLSTIVAADQILVVQRGKIIERGTHRELLKIEGGKYRSLWSKQVAQTLGGLGDDVAMKQEVIGEAESAVDEVKEVVQNQSEVGLEGSSSSVRVAAEHDDAVKPKRRRARGESSVDEQSTAAGPGEAANEYVLPPR